MASVNIYKGGYGQVAPLDMEDNRHHHLPIHKSPTPPNRSSTARILAVSAFLVLLVIAVSLAVVFGTSSHSSHPHKINSAESIRLVCNVTHYPDSCFATISSLNASPTPDPEQILNLSIRVCFEHVVAVAMSLNVSNSDRSEALKECGELYEDARGRIGDALQAMVPGLTESKVNDVQTWLSAALTDQETCLDGLVESVKVKLEEFKVNAEKLNEYLSNSLAIVANIRILLHQFGLQLH